jgi:hypothetical protein
VFAFESECLLGKDAVECNALLEDKKRVQSRAEQSSVWNWGIVLGVEGRSWSSKIIEWIEWEVERTSYKRCRGIQIQVLISKL